MPLASTMSYRKTRTFLNRVRHEESGTPLRTIADRVEREGASMQQRMDQQTADILKAHQFTDEGAPTTKSERFGLAALAASLPRADIAQAVETYNRDKNETFQIPLEMADAFYEDPHKTIQVSIDDVGVKKQKVDGRTSERKTKESREYAHNTIAHVEKNQQSYILNGTGTLQVLRLLVAFLLHNRLLTDHYIQFYVDGARSLHGAIADLFAWLPHVRVILDWYHLEKKCEYELSLTLRGSKIRNAILDKLLPLLWLGQIDKAILYLNTLPTDQLKSGQTVERLIGYFERNRACIPCYALRKQLGLRNSSNKGEKANDLCVATRQKHNGMSWSLNGSVSLATITAMHINDESEHWCNHHQLAFKFAS